MKRVAKPIVTADVSQSCLYIKGKRYQQVPHLIAVTFPENPEQNDQKNREFHEAIPLIELYRSLILQIG
jgi:hypothetical protein